MQQSARKEPWPDGPCLIWQQVSPSSSSIEPILFLCFLCTYPDVVVGDLSLAACPVIGLVGQDEAVHAAQVTVLPRLTDPRRRHVLEGGLRTEDTHRMNYRVGGGIRRDAEEETG